MTGNRLLFKKVLSGMIFFCEEETRRLKTQIIPNLNRLNQKIISLLVGLNKIDFNYDN